MQEVVVSANRTATNMSHIAVPAQLISKDYIKNTGNQRLQDILQEITGLTLVNNTMTTSLNGYPNPFGQGIQMLGLDPAYTAILLDGEPLVGRNGGILKLGRLATGALQKIEIVKGPASSLFGSEAMAGVINLITQPPEKTFLETQLHAASNQTFGQTISFGTKRGNSFFQGFLNRYQTQGYDLDPYTYGKTMDAYRDLHANIRYNIRINATTQICTSVRLYNSKQQNNYQIDWQNTPSVVGGTNQEKDQTLFFQLSSRYAPKQLMIFRAFADNYSNQSYVNLIKTGQRFDETSFKQSILKPEFQWQLEAGAVKWIYGGGLYHERIEASRYAGAKTLNTIYSFLQSEWSLFKEKLIMIGGARLDKRTDYTWNASPRIALAYKPNPTLKLTASVGGGFKAPDFRHMFLSFYNTQIGYSLIGANVLSDELQKLERQGELEAGSNIVPFLQPITLFPEKSMGMHVGLFLSKPTGSLEVSVFRNDVQNLIDVYLLPVRKTNNRSLYSYRNIHQIYTQGIEANYIWKPSTAINFSVGYQYLEAKDKEVLEQIRAGKLYKRDPINYTTALVKKSDYFGLNNRSKHTLNAKLILTEKKSGLQFFLRWNYRGKFGYADINGNNIADDERELAPGFSLMNLSCSRSFQKRYNIQIGCDNLLGYTDPTIQPQLAGRTFFLNLQFQLTKPFNHQISTK